MLTIEQAATGYGVTVIRAAEPEAFRVIGFELTGEHVACTLFHRIINATYDPLPGVRVRVINGGDKVTFPSNAEGWTDMAMGDNQSAYWPEHGDSGPYSAEIYGGPSDNVHGLGWFHGTDHMSLITIWQAPGEGAGDMTVQVVDEQGNPLSEYKFQELFRFAGVVTYADQRFECVKLIWRQARKADMPHPLTVTVLDKAGNPLSGIEVNATLGPSVETGADGRAVFWMGDPWRYSVPSEPAGAVGVNKRRDGGSDAVKVGWVMGEHRWLDVVLQERATGVPSLPAFHGLAVSSRSFSVGVQCAGASTVGYTLDGPDYHDEDRLALGENGTLLVSYALQPETTYHLKCWGRNAAGDGPDAPLEFTTLEEVPGPEPTDLAEALGRIKASAGAICDEVDALLEGLT